MTDVRIETSKLLRLYDNIKEINNKEGIIQIIKKIKDGEDLPVSSVPTDKTSELSNRKGSSVPTDKAPELSKREGSSVPTDKTSELSKREGSSVPVSSGNSKGKKFTTFFSGNTNETSIKNLYTVFSYCLKCDKDNKQIKKGSLLFKLPDHVYYEGFGMMKKNLSVSVSRNKISIIRYKLDKQGKAVLLNEAELLNDNSDFFPTIRHMFENIGDENTIENDTISTLIFLNDLYKFYEKIEKKTEIEDSELETFKNAAAFYECMTSQATTLIFTKIKDNEYEIQIEKANGESRKIEGLKINKTKYESLFNKLEEEEKKKAEDVTIKPTRQSIQSSTQPSSQSAQSSTQPSSQSARSSTQPSSKPAQSSNQPSSQPLQSSIQTSSQPLQSSTQPSSQPLQSSTQPSSQPLQSSTQPSSQPLQSSIQTSSQPLQSSIQTSSQPLQSSIQTSSQPLQSSIQTSSKPAQSSQLVSQENTINLPITQAVTNVILSGSKPNSAVVGAEILQTRPTKLKISLAATAYIKRGKDIQEHIDSDHENIEEYKKLKKTLLNHINKTNTAAENFFADKTVSFSTAICDNGQDGKKCVEFVSQGELRQALSMVQINGEFYKIFVLPERDKNDEINVKYLVFNGKNELLQNKEDIPFKMNLNFVDGNKQEAAKQIAYDNNDEKYIRGNYMQHFQGIPNINHKNTREKIYEKLEHNKSQSSFVNSLKNNEEIQKNRGYAREK